MILYSERPATATNQTLFPTRLALKKSTLSSCSRILLSHQATEAVLEKGKTSAHQRGLRVLLSDVPVPEAVLPPEPLSQAKGHPQRAALSHCGVLLKEKVILNDK